MDFKKYYDSIWVGRDQYFHIHRARFLQTFDFVLAHRSPKAGYVLDVGGVGPVSAFMKESLGWHVESTATDLRKPLQIPDTAFDLILCTETIEHVKDIDSDRIADLEYFNFSGVKSMLRELRRSMRSDGRLIITTPNANSFITLHKWLGGEALLMDPGHVREFSVQDLRRVACECELVEIVISTIDSWSDFGGLVPELRDTLRRFSEFHRVPRADNIIAAFGR